MSKLPLFDSQLAKRLICVMLSAVLFVAGFPLLGGSHASAAQITNRSIKMSDSSPSGGSITSGVGSGQNATYEVSFQALNSASSLIIDFCKETSLIAATCTTPTGMGAATGITQVAGQAGGTGWAMTSTAGQIKLAQNVVGPTAPTVAVNAVAGNLNGSYLYKVTYVTNGVESPGGTTSAAVAPVNQQVNLSAIPTGPAGTTARKIYRTAAGGADGTQKLVATISDNTTTTYTDNIADASLGAAVPASQAITSGTQTFDLTGITNTSTVGTFYARIYTFSNNSYGTYASATSPGNYVDFGGIALSTVNVITITARVQEQLTFCVTKAVQSSWTTTSDCSDPVVGSAANLPALQIGHANNGIIVLDSSAVDTATIYSQLSSNATNGVVVRMRNSNLTCGGLSSNGGTSCAIPAQNGGSGAGASAMTAGTAAFGLFVSASTLGTNGTGTLTPAGAYYNAAHVTVPTDVWYGMDTATANNNVTSAYGSTICSTTAPLYRVNTNYTFAATSALTTPAGIYTANLSMIATGTF